MPPVPDPGEKPPINNEEYAALKAAFTADEKHSLLSAFLCDLDKKHGADAVSDFLNRHTPKPGEENKPLTLNLNKQEERVLKDLSYAQEIFRHQRRGALQRGAAIVTLLAGGGSMTGGIGGVGYDIANGKFGGLPTDLALVGGGTALFLLTDRLFSASRHHTEQINAIERCDPPARRPIYADALTQANKELAGPLFNKYREMIVGRPGAASR